MRNVIILGSQWGDEGKGKIVDLFSERFDIVARYQGGHNAGHTVFIGEKKFVLKLIPSGILRPGKQAVIGNGLVIDPAALLSEIETLESAGVGRILESLHQQPRPRALSRTSHDGKDVAKAAKARSPSAPLRAALARATRTRPPAAASASPTSSTPSSSARNTTP